MLSGDRKQPRSTRALRKCYAAARLTLYPVRMLLFGNQRRYVLRWIGSTAPKYLLRRPSPWVTFEAIDYIDERVAAGWKVFEYGSGGSTLYWLSRGAECVSVEHDSSWYEGLRPFIPADAKIDYRLVPPGPSAGDDFDSEWGDPNAYRSSVEEFKHHSFREYAEQIDEFPEEYFDLVLVDGRARPSCIKHAVSRVKPDGLLVVDNGDRPHYYRRTADHLEINFQKISCRGVCPVSPRRAQTDIFVKKSSGQGLRSGGRS
jgi:hypothetical protein